MEFVRTRLKKEFIIDNLITVHYFEFAKHFVFNGERHDFWEFLYVDEGCVEVVAESNGFILSQGDIIFHKPNEFHSVSADRSTAPNVVVISFECNTDAMNYFENKIFSLGNTERDVLLKIVKQSREAFEEPLGDPEVNVLSRKDKTSFGSEQLIKNYLEILLIGIIRQGNENQHSKLSSATKERSDNETVMRLEELIRSDLRKNFSIGELCDYSKMSKTGLTGIFRDKFGTGVAEHLRNMKILEAKKLIREGTRNFSEISEELGYGSIHYFSRFFKKSVGCSPSEYAKSIKGRLENEEP